MKQNFFYFCCEAEMLFKSFISFAITHNDQGNVLLSGSINYKVETNLFRFAQSCLFDCIL